MSLSFKKQNETQTQTQTQKSQTDPWDETIPYLRDFLSRLDMTGKSSTVGATGAQTQAASQLRDLGLGGTPRGAEIDKLAGDLLGTKSRATELDPVIGDFKRRLTPTADGTNRDVMNNPLMADMLTKTGDDVATRINAQFAGAGRDLSGYNQRAIGEGVTRAQLPVLFDQYNLEQGRTDAAARDLFAGEAGTITTKDMLDRMAAGQRTSGVDVARAKAEMDRAGPEMVMELEQKLKKLPYEDLSYIAELLFPAAGLGGQSEGTAVTKGKKKGWGVGGTVSVKDLFKFPTPGGGDPMSG